VGEAVTNIAAAPIESLNKLKLSANWMAACGSPGEDAALFDTVKAIGMKLCPALGISIPVGKIRCRCAPSGRTRRVQRRKLCRRYRLSFRRLRRLKMYAAKLTPQLQRGTDTVLISIDLGRGKNRLGAAFWRR